MGGQIPEERGSTRHTAGAGCAVCQGHRSLGKVGNDSEKSIHKTVLMLLPHCLCCLHSTATAGSILMSHVAVCLRFGKNILGYLGWQYLS